MSRSLGAVGRSWHSAFPKVLTPRLPAPLHGSGEPRKELGNGESCGDSAGAASPGSPPPPAGSVPYYSRHFRGRRGAQRPARKSGQTARNRCQLRGAHSHPAGQGAGRGGHPKPNPTPRERHRRLHPPPRSHFATGTGSGAGCLPVAMDAGSCRQRRPPRCSGRPGGDSLRGERGTSGRC